jgi:hypothetical protein
MNEHDIHEAEPALGARLALAHHLQGAIDRGLVADRAAIARKLGLTRARVTQLLDILLLAPDLCRPPSSSSKPSTSR